MDEITNSPVLRILLLEDDQDDKKFFKEALTELNIHHEITFASDCFNLINLLFEKIDFDIIFLDLNIPEINGIECLKRIKSNDAYKNIPVIIFTGSKSQSAMDEAYLYGAHHYIVKPFSHLNYKASLKIIFDLNWKEKQPLPPQEKYVVNLAFN